jgi:hypothetical protein
MRVADRSITLGYAVASGGVVAIPVRHLVICGQTQESGKTTCLEGLIARSTLRAVTFITKRGESAFYGAARIEPYFREQADWQYVAAILEASRGEKLKMERAWIIRASKGAQSLADVQRNVRKALVDPKVRGMSADMYLQLDAYLDIVVPQIAKTRWAPALKLRPGVNAVDLTTLPDEMQHLVIKSSLNWVLEREENTIVVIPEAWKFCPEGRGTPVKLSALALIRQGAALKNYVWLDSQDIGGIDKAMLRSVPVWLLGVQRESNEIKRTLNNIPAGIAKPSKAAIATLELGQFIACWGTHAIKTYAQPSWLDENTARLIATGGMHARDVGLPPRVKERTTVDADEAARLRSENQKLRDENTIFAQVNIELKRRIVALEEKGNHADQPHRSELPKNRKDAASDSGTPRRPTSDEQPTDRVERRDHRPTGDAARAVPPGDDTEALYQAFKARLIEDAPALLRLLTERSELTVEVKRAQVTLDGTSLAGRLAQLIADGWFDEPRGGTTTWAELQRRGFTGANNTNREMARLAEKGFLTKEDGGYQAVRNMKINIVEAA